MIVLSLSSCCTAFIDGMVPESEWRCIDMVVRDDMVHQRIENCITEQEISIKRWRDHSAPRSDRVRSGSSIAPHTHTTR
jgi:hypothetical protein